MFLIFKLSSSTPNAGNTSNVLYNTYGDITIDVMQQSNVQHGWTMFFFKM